MLEPGTEEEKWCKEQHLANNTFESSEGNELGRREQGVQRPGQQQGYGHAGRMQSDAGLDLFGTSPSDGRAGDGGRGSYIEGEDVRVVVVRITEGRISDWKGGVKDWVIRDREREQGREGMVNGVEPE